MTKIRNLRELELMKKNLEYRQLLSEKKLLNSSVNIVDNVTDGLKDWAFEWGTSLVLRLFFGRHRNEDPEEETE